MIISNCVEALSTDHGYFVDICGQLTANFAAYYVMGHQRKTFPCTYFHEGMGCIAERELIFR